MNKLLDANAILRYLLNDDKKQAQAVYEQIKSGAFTIGEVMAEVVYVLQGLYCLKRFLISDGLKSFIKEIDIKDKPVIRNALDLYAQNNLDYVDCILVSRKQILNEEIFSFDKKLNKQLQENQY